MEFVEGDRITDVDVLNQKFGSAANVSNVLIDIYARMIFLHGHIHCDAHPGNILIRKQPNGKPQIVLLDHGFYCSTGE
jgi:aarF domain-containing kinase